MRSGCASARGVHTGEVERRGTNVAGIGVHIGARVGALAAGDQILDTSTVRELASFAGRFLDAGEPN